MSKEAGANWAFKIMCLIHDNPLRYKFSDPYKTLKNAGLKPKQNVLEVGCGPGFFSIPAARIVETGTIFANDIHPLAIKKVKEKMKREDITNIKTIHSSATETGLPDQSIDVAFLFGVPRLIKNEKIFNELLDELYRVIRKEGIIAVKTSRRGLVEIVENKNFTFLNNIHGIYRFTKK